MTLDITDASSVAEARQEIRNALATMTPTERTMVLLAANGESAVSIAVELGLSIVDVLAILDGAQQRARMAR